MSEFMSGMNSAGEAFVAFAIRMLVQSSVLILVLLILDRLLRKRTRAVVRYWIWMLVLAKLVLPPSLSSPTSLTWWLADKLPQTPSAVVGAPAESTGEVLLSSPMPEVSVHDFAATQPAIGPAASPAATIPARVDSVTAPVLIAPTWEALLLSGWLVVVAVMLALLTQRALFVRRLVAQSQDASEPLLDLLAHCRRQMRVGTPVRLRVTSVSASPSVCGLARPTILIPQGMLAHLDGGQWKSILLHELAHVRRADLWVNLAQTLLQIAYVYNPLLWLANATIRKVREQAVDETVLAAMGDEAEEYPRTLLNISKLAFGRPSLTLRLIGVVESKRTLIARIKHIASRPFPTTAKLGLVGVVFVFAVAMTLLPMARRTQASTPATPDKQGQSSGFQATLSNGLTVEVLGVREFPGTDASWWRPDGSPATGREFPEFETTDPDYTAPDARVRLLAIRLAGSSLDGASLSRVWKDARPNSFFPRYEGDQKRVLQSIQILMGRLPDDAVTTDLRIGVAAGAWKDAAAGSQGHTTAYATDNITQSEVIYHPVRDQNGSLHITATHLIGSDYDCRIVAEDEAHNVFEPVRYSNTGGTMRLCTSVLNISPAQVKMFRLQARPYEWVEFEDIRIIPGSQDAKTATKQASEGSPATRAPVGLVVDEKGAPVPDARVLLFHRRSRWGLNNRVVEETRTNAQGRFVLTEPLAYKNSNGTTYTDHFLLFATHPDHAMAWQVIVAGEEQAEYRLTMTEPATQAFRVTDREGNPLANARVWICGAGLSDDANPLLRPYVDIPEDLGLITATTDGQGRAALVNLPRTHCSFRASLPGYSNRYAGVDMPPQGEMHVEMTRAATVTGRVLTADGKPVVGAEVWFQADWGEWYFDYAVTDETGQFLNDKMVARGGSWVESGGSGQYKVTVRHPEFIAPETVVQLEPGRTDTFDIEAVPGTLLRIRVLEPETERPLAGVRVGGSSEGGRIDGYTDANGVFERQVLNGEASVFFSSPPGGTYAVEGTTRTGTSVTAEGGVKELTLYAPSRLHPLVNIKGRLMLPDGSPAGGIKISTTNNIARYDTATFTGTGSASARTNPNGTFDLKDVPRDVEVFLYGQTSDRKYILAEVLDPAQASPELARPLVMREGATGSVVVTDKAGKPQANMALKILPRKWDHHLFRADDRTVTTDADGRLTVDGVVPGLEYFIRDAKADLSESGWWNLYNENRVLLPLDGDAAVLTTPAPQGNGVISGTVVDPNGKPIAGAYVSLENTDLLVLPQPMKFGSQMRKVMRANGVQTDLQGQFRITDLNPGVTEVRAGAQRYRTEWTPNVAAGTEGLRIVLGEPRPYQLSGMVVDEAGRSIEGVEVAFVEETSPGRAAEKGNTSTTLRTDRTGAFRLDRSLSPIDWTTARRSLFARKEGYAVWGDDLDGTGGQPFIRITLRPSETVAGAVIDEAGKPIAGAVLTLRSCRGQRGEFVFTPTSEAFAPQATTDAHGVFTLAQLPNESDVFLQVRAEGYASGKMPSARTGQFGSYAIKRDKGSFEVPSTVEDPNAPLVITLQKAATLRGAVVYEGTNEPAKAVRVLAQSRQASSSAEATTDSQGRFELTGLSPAPCNLMVVEKGLARNISPEWTAAAIHFDDLQPGETRDGLQLVLTKGILVRGRVTDAEGHPLRGIDIAFYSAARPRSGAACQSILTAADGTWAYPFPPGEVYIYIRTKIPGAGWRRETYDYNVIAGKAIENVDFVLNREVPENSPHRGVSAGSAGAPAAKALSPVLAAADAGSGSTALSGKVVDSQGKPVAGAEVTLYELTPGELGVLPNVERIDSKTTGAEGTFTFSVAKNARSYREGCVIVRKTGLSVAWAQWPMHEDHKLSIALSQPMELAGEVVDEAGKPIAGAEVHIAMAKIGKGENRRELRIFGFLRTQTDGKGRFVFADMPAGATFEFFVEKPLRATISTIDISTYSREQCQFAPGQAGIRLVLPAEARVEGVVRLKADGKPVGGVVVAAHADRRGNGGPIPSKLAVTGPDGTFGIGGLAAGDCTVELWTPRGQKPEWVATAMSVRLKAGQTRNGLWLDLTKGGFIEVLIRDPAGKPVEKMNAHFELIGQRQGFGEHTDANGLARVRALPGDYRVAQIYRPGYTPPETTDQVTVEEGQTQRVEFIVTPTPKIAGVVRDEAGNPLAGVKVQTTWIKMGSSGTSAGESDASGRFDLEWDSSSFGQGANSIVFVARDPARNLAQVLDIDEGVGPLDIKLKPGLIVAGTVLDQDGKPLPEANARVLLRAPMATVRLGWDELATTGPDGVFEVKGIPLERQYVVEVSADGYGKREIAIDSPAPREGRHDIGQVKLALSDLAVSGLVIDPNDEPVAGAEVRCFGAGQPDLRDVQTDAQGRFTVAGLSPGSVHLYVNPQGQSPLSGNTDAEAGATDVQIRVYERRSAQAGALARGASLKGKPLPPLEDLGIELPADAKGKKLLLCFWDMDQRPSRNAATQLAERTKELMDKGLVIVAVQSTRADQAHLNQWIDQNKIPFSVGRIQGDVGKTRSAWGVRSLPWLILTDGDHIVQAEGFDLSELQNRMEGVASGPGKTRTP